MLPEHKLNFSLCARGPWEGPIGMETAVKTALKVLPVNVVNAGMSAVSESTRFNCVDERKDLGKDARRLLLYLK
jgi:hypothetical protein